MTKAPTPQKPIDNTGTAKKWVSPPLLDLTHRLPRQKAQSQSAQVRYKVPVAYCLSVSKSSPAISIHNPHAIYRIRIVKAQPSQNLRL